MSQGHVIKIKTAHTQYRWDYIEDAFNVRLKSIKCFDVYDDETLCEEYYEIQYPAMIVHTFHDESRWVEGIVEERRKLIYYDKDETRVFEFDNDYVWSEV